MADVQSGRIVAYRSVSRLSADPGATRETGASQSGADWIKHATVVWLAVLSVSELVYLFFDFQPAGTVGQVAFCALCLCIAPRFSLREFVLSAMAVALALGLLAVEKGAAGFSHALDRAVFFAAFIYLVTLLKEAAERSTSILQIGHYLTNQPPGRRYFSTAVGGHFLGVLLNFGAVSLLAPLIQRGARADPIETEQDERRARAREQRQLSALIRGFSWMIMWAPTALTQAVLFTALPDVDITKVMALGFLSAVIMILIGRLEDLYRWRHIVVSRPPVKPTFPGRSAAILLFVCTILIGCTYVVVLLADVSTAVALMLVAPIVVAGWVTGQSWAHRPAVTMVKSKNTLSDILSGSAAVLSRNAVALGMAGFIGQAAATLAPVEAIAESLRLQDIPPWLFLAALPLIINLGGQIALSPLMLVVFLAAIMRELR